MKAAIYLRQSIDRYGDELAISRQREDCIKICEGRGWTHREYVDNDKSATTGRRPAYQKMLDDIRAGLIDAVVVGDLDRLHRRPIELEYFIDLADEKHVALASVGGDADLSTDNGRLFARIKGAVARAEVERKSARRSCSGRPGPAGRQHPPQSRVFDVEADTCTAADLPFSACDPRSVSRDSSAARGVDGLVGEGKFWSAASLNGQSGPLPALMSLLTGRPN